MGSSSRPIYLPGELPIYLFRYSERDTSIHFAKALRKALAELNPASSAIPSMVIRESASRRRRLSSTLNRFTSSEKETPRALFNNWDS